MRKEIKWFIVGILLALSVSALADNWQTISVQPNLINVVVNGEKLNADNFLYNDTTYVPIRVVSEALNFNVEYDEGANTAYIEKKGKSIAMIAGTTVPDWAKGYLSEAEIYIDGGGIQYAAYNIFEINGLLKKTGIEANPITNGEYNMVLYNKGGNRWHDTNYVEQKWVPIKENIPYIFVNGYCHISLEYFHNEILPLDEDLR